MRLKSFNAGELAVSTDETRNLRWESEDTIRSIISEKPELFYPMHINALKKYLIILMNN